MKVREIRLPLLLLVEVCWGWALAAVLAQIFSGGGAPGPSVAGTAVVVLGSFGVATALRELDVDERTTRIIGVAATVVCLGLVIPVEYSGALTQIGPERGAMFGAGVAFVSLWVRGVLRARAPEDFDGPLRSVVLGLIPIAIAAGTLPDAHGPQAFGALAVLYAMLGLLVLALYRTSEPARPIRALTSQWGAATIGIVGGALLLLLLAAAVDPGSFGFVGPIGEPLRVAGRAFAQYVLGPPLALLGKLFAWLLPDTGRQFRLQPPQPQEQPPPEPKQDSPWSISVRYLIGGLIVAAVVLAALLLLALLFHRNRRPPGEEEPQENERAGTLGEDLSDLFSMLGNRLRRRHTRPSAVAIRRLYGEMLDQASDDGLDRPPSATPLQFAPQLDARYGTTLPTDITNAFAASRYGARDVDDRVVRDLRARWDEHLRRRP